MGQLAESSIPHFSLSKSSWVQAARAEQHVRIKKMILEYFIDHLHDCVIKVSAHIFPGIIP